MSNVTMTTAAEPDGAPRIAVLDILRGVAILGILFMNINDMGQSLYASFDDIRHLGWSQTDQIAWWLREVFANGTARCMLEMLFGAGMVILTDRVADKADGWEVMRRYYIRNLILFAFGLVHVFILLWPGDILHTYGIAALIAFLFRRLRPQWLIMVGLTLALFQLGGGGYFGYYLTLQTRAQVAAIEAKVAAGAKPTAQERKLLQDKAEGNKKRAEARAKSRLDIAAEDKARKGSFRTWATAQWGSFLEIESQFLEILFVWEAASVMLIGAALYKLGILQGRRSRRFYAGMAILAYGVGITLRAVGAHEQMEFGDGPYTFWASYEVARQAMTLGHVALINLLVSSAFGARLLRPFVAAGRTALSIYIAQTLICLWVLYPPFMLGLYGKMTWGPLMVTAFVINAVLLIGANVWVRYFNIAPVEWAWRSLVERRVLPWRKRAWAARPPEGRPTFA
ncbi:DUF418 domain-containing protein [Sphingomonas sp.]|jgi:uncharacterized protein|uniref:DUF418 domain-containing protein n=1 Tax=Sphingomonas sp. TaxID=28214 RepID=UPI003569D3CA